MTEFEVNYQEIGNLEKYIFKPFAQTSEWVDHNFLKYLFDGPRLQFGYIKTKKIILDLSSVAVSSNTIDKAYEEARQRAKKGKLENFKFPFETAN